MQENRHFYFTFFLHSYNIINNNNGYNYKLYNKLCPGNGEPDSNIIEYAKDVLIIINELINIVDNK